MRPQRLVLAGSVLVDVLAELPRLPPRGGDVLATGGGAVAGGGATVLTAAARLGLPAAYAGVHGPGPFGALVRAALAADGVELLLTARETGDTGCCLVLVEPDGERTMVTLPGVEAALTTDDLAAVRPRAGDAVYVSGYDLLYPVNGPLLAAWCAQLPEGVLLVLDPGPLGADVPPERLSAVLGRCDLLTVAAGEEPAAGASVPPDSVVVQRDGPSSARVTRAGEVLAAAEPPSVRAVDTTGAGDVHTGALLAARHAGLGWPAALRRANAAAAVSVTRRGPGQGPALSDLPPHPPGSRS